MVHPSCIREWSAHAWCGTDGRTAWHVCSDRVELLNRCTEVINFWQDETTKHTIAEAQAKFDDCKFVGC